MSTIDVVCLECGADIEIEMSVQDTIKVNPCKACIKQAQEEGRVDGYDECLDDYDL